MSFGRLESQALAVPTGGWPMSFTDGGGAHPITVPAGTYSPTTLLAAMITAMNTASADDYTGTIDNGEGGTGASTISNDANTIFSVTWTSTDLRDALGFAASLSVNTSYTSTRGMRGLWMPNSPTSGRYGRSDPGHTEGGIVQTVSPLGAVKSIGRPSRVRLPPVTWSHVGAARARQAAETGVPLSWERFIRDTMLGAVSYFTPGGTVRLYWDAASLTDYTAYWPIAPKSTALERADTSWSGLYAVSFEGWAA